MKYRVFGFGVTIWSYMAWVPRQISVTVFETGRRFNDDCNPVTVEMLWAPV